MHRLSELCVEGVASLHIRTEAAHRALVEEAVRTVHEAVVVYHEELAVRACHIRQGIAVERPLAAKDVLHKIVARTRPKSARAVERGHERMGVAHVGAACILPRKQIYLARGLLAHPNAYAVTVGFLVVEDEVLGASHDILRLHFLNFFESRNARKIRILGEVLRRSAAECDAVDIKTRRIKPVKVLLRSVVSASRIGGDRLTHKPICTHAERRSNDALAGHRRISLLGVADAVRTVVLVGHGLCDARKRGSESVAIRKRNEHIALRDLVEELVPLVVVVLKSRHHRESEVGTCVAELRHGCILFLYYCLMTRDVVLFLHLVGERKRRLLARKRAEPISARDVHDVAVVLFGVGYARKAVGIHKVEPVYDLCSDSRFRKGIRRIVRPCRRLREYFFVHGAVIEYASRHGSVARFVHAVSLVITLKRENVVYRLVRVSRRREIVLAAVENVCSSILRVVRTQLFEHDAHIPHIFLVREGRRKRLFACALRASLGIQYIGLSETYELDGRLFYAERTGIISVRFLKIELHHFLARECARVFHLYGDIVCRDRVAAFDLFHFEIAVGKTCVGQAVTERIGDCARIVELAHSRGFHNVVFIASLVVAIADIYALDVNAVKLLGAV